jgi:hypothetical protein
VAHPGFGGPGRGACRSPSTPPLAAPRSATSPPSTFPEVRGLLRPVTAYLALTAPDGTNVALTSPLTVAVDGDRFLVLQPAASTSAPPDLAACARLLRDSFDAQPDAWVRSHVESSVTTSRTRVMTLVAVGIVGVIVGLDLLPGRTRLDRFDGAWERRQAARGSPFAA